MKQKQKEKWRWVVGYCGLYKVSNKGRIKSYHPGRHYKRILKGSIDNNGYIVVVLTKRRNKWKQYTVHRLVLLAFKGPPPSHRKRCCRHLDGDPGNNNLKNLKWGSHKKNTRDRLKHGTYYKSPRGSKHAKAILTEKDIPMIRKMYNVHGYDQQYIGDLYGVKRVTISSIIIGRNWGHVL